MKSGKPLHEALEALGVRTSGAKGGSYRLTLVDFAERTGISRRSLVNWLKEEAEGRDANPSEWVWHILRLESGKTRPLSKAKEHDLVAARYERLKKRNLQDREKARQEQADSGTDAT